MENKTAQQGHPPGLYLLFFTEMWERFSYYGMRALLVLYLTSNVVKLERATALEIYAIFTSLAYVTPIIGGLLADKILGQRKAVFIGGILMLMGQFALSFGIEYLNLGLGFLIVGNGFFKPNISTVVGALYEENDSRKDSAFTIFYMGINLGAFIAPLICIRLVNAYNNWGYGFAAAGVGMILGLVIFFVGSKTLGIVGLPPNSKQTHLLPKDYLDIILYVIISVCFVFGVLNFWNILSDYLRWRLILSVAIIGIIGLSCIIVLNTEGYGEWGRVIAIFILLFFNIFFWAGFEQAGGTFNLFAAENTNRNILGLITLEAADFQSFNAIFIFAIAPLFSIMWIALSKMNREPSIPLKFVLALFLLGVGFIIMYFAGVSAKGGVQVSSMWLISVYFFHTLAELCLSPVGLSMITKLAPQKIVSVMMGLWFFSIALAQYLAGVLEQLLKKLKLLYEIEIPLFLFLTLTSFIGALILLALVPFLRKMMKGIS